jgi:acyl carrier protein
MMQEPTVQGAHPGSQTQRSGLKKQRGQLSTAYDRPQSDLEARVAAVLSEVLGVEPIGRTDDFFELGGNSLLGMRVTEQIAEACGVQIPPRRFYEGPNVADLAAAIRELQ